MCGSKSRWDGPASWLWLIAVGLATTALASLDSQRARADETPGARDMLLRCLKNQEATERASFKMETDIVLKQPDRQVRQHTETRLYRDGDRVDSKGRLEYLDDPNRSHDFQSIVDKDRFVQSLVPLTTADGTAPKMWAMISQKRSPYFWSVVAVPHYGGFLDGYVGGTGGKRLVSLMLEQGNFQRLEPEVIGNTRCEVVMTSGRRGTATVWMSPNEGFAIKKFKFEKVSGNLGAGDTPLAPPTTPDQGATKIGLSTIADEFELSKIGDAYIALSGKLTYKTRYSDGTEANETYSSRRKEVTIQPDFKVLSVFQMDLPNGTPVSDWDHAKSGLKYEWRDGNVVPAHADFEVDAKGIFNKSNQKSWLIVVNIVLFLGLVVWLTRTNAKRRHLHQA
ncbi:hypothetical protein Sinac_7263 [Singulisphaera acidiphila DSM 18658]|uniref:Uncharacterized protein n=2 Tax=Singulisphaera acidiphila TaxID=466153 RepID=L0DQR5_SINAD|nr:hypothetical protein Sinac_7263 [Singulisphaera acidiphila DSM 18658]